MAGDPDPDDGFLYPLRRGERLGGAEWVELRYHEVLGSRWRTVMTASPEAGFFGALLWWESLRQDPAGTLPDDADELAHLAGLGLDRDRWLRLAPRAGIGALYGWRRCVVACAAGEDAAPAPRLWHRTVLAVVTRSLGQMRGRQAAASSGARRVQLLRVRRHLAEAPGLSRRAASSPVTAEVVRAWLSARSLPVTFANVCLALDESSKSNVVQMPER